MLGASEPISRPTSIQDRHQFKTDNKLIKIVSKSLNISRFILILTSFVSQRWKHCRKLTFFHLFLWFFHLFSSFCSNFKPDTISTPTPGASADAPDAPSRTSTWASWKSSSWVPRRRQSASLCWFYDIFIILLLASLLTFLYRQILSAQTFSAEALHLIDFLVWHRPHARSLSSLDRLDTRFWRGFSPPLSVKDATIGIKVLYLCLAGIALYTLRCVHASL